MAKLKIQLIQINNNFGDNYYIPYSIGLLKAYCEKDEAIKSSCEFKPFVYARKAVKDIVDVIGDVDVLALSCYVWNWNICCLIAAEVRKRNKMCLIIVGGPQVPFDADGMLRKHNYIDLAVQGEGEETFYQIIKAILDKKPFNEILGLSYNDRTSGRIIHSGKRAELVDINKIPSPYLSGVFNELVANKEVQWVACWETNRGCPFSCSYCYWGGRSTRLRQFEIDRLNYEIEWFGRNNIPLVFGCDGNYGILNRDVELVERLVKTKQKYGFPRTFRVCNTKNSNEISFEIGKLLYDSGMFKVISISMQSLSDDVLKNIRRNNVKLDSYQELAIKYMKAGIPTYTELIIALPGETYDSFIEGINTLLKRGQHSQLNIYNCSILVNSEMAEPSYQEKYGIKTVTIPVFQAHSTKSGAAEISESEEIVVATNSMANDKWHKVQCFAWAVLCFHYLGIFKLVAAFLYGKYQIGYRDIYESLLSFAMENPNTHIGKELIVLDGILDNVLKGIGFDQYCPDYGNITWPAEEASFLRLSENADELYQELSGFLREFLLKKNIISDSSLIEEVIKYQKARLRTHSCGIGFDYDGHYRTLSLSYNLVEYIDSVMSGSPVLIRQESNDYLIDCSPDFGGDKKKFAQEIVWYGRKGGKFLYSIKQSKEVKL